ncbi:hypothetical protein K402DRAFT_468019 [Aulographum hederae CBS 113979]|uniref:Uncharacterized protein n=1 Tax=Aulographum hederae CBS 113979 TaxID=1176131 RepID=A0A6G1GIY7_9PEZI|nr:hypothetical protein K402DRAFT_468019 [Aulographum hederae CBS 113979]
MSGFTTFLKTLLPPLLVSLFLYVVLTHAVLPFYRRYRQTRSYPLLPVGSPLPIPTSASSTLGALRHRVQDFFTDIVLPSRWGREYGNYSRRNRVVDGSRRRGADGGDSESGEDLEELMDGFGNQDQIDAARREALERRRSEGFGDSERRLSRDLEEGFRDSSDDDDEHTGGRRTTILRA